ncbi:efflux RND transporter permease subunit [Patescibacteria group bacterium]|nr:efflux RND transporter permease subunit [Patescibacteria group bacterium]
MKQSIIATVAMPLSFFITFIFLNTYGYTLNFLTNFSLVLSFGM